jgi:hypothetical protein
MMSAAVAGPTFRPIASYTTLRDVTVLGSGLVWGGGSGVVELG